jgi:hypothetical protein
MRRDARSRTEAREDRGGAAVGEKATNTADGAKEYDPE